MGFLDSIKAMFGGGPKRSATEEWLLGAEAIVTDAGDDAADWDANDAREALAQWWGIEGRDDALASLERLGGGDGVWDFVRAIHVSRMSAGAQYITREEARVHGARVGQRAQQRCDSWQALATDYWAARRQWAEEGGYSMEPQDVLQQKMGRLHYEAWSHIPFDTPLTEADPSA